MEGDFLLAGIRSRLTYANVISTLCLFLLLGGGAYAAFNLPRTSVKSKHIAPDAVKGTDVNEGTLGQVASAANAGTLDNKDSGEFQAAGTDGWTPLALNDGTFGTGCHWRKLFGDDFATPSFFRDREGIVHLRGMVQAADGDSASCGDYPEFDYYITREGGRLQPGYLPESRAVFSIISVNKPGRVDVLADSSIKIEPGYPTWVDAKQWISLDGISWRCAPAGENGCP
jgi:hypothetical protein